MLYSLTSKEWTQEEEPMTTNWVLGGFGDKHELRFISIPYTFLGAFVPASDELPYQLSVLRLPQGMADQDESQPSGWGAFVDPELNKLGVPIHRMMVALCLEMDEKIPYRSGTVNPLRLFIGPQGWFRSVAHWATLKKKDPGHKDGATFQFDFGDRPMFSRADMSMFPCCTVTPVADHTLSDLQIEYLKELKSAGTIYDLRELCQAATEADVRHELMSIFNKASVCPDCQGSKKYIGLSVIKDCPTCKGKGTV